jgi:hypothetical protein
MSFASIANNQCVSCNNLQDATVNPPFYLVAFPSNPIPVSTKQITKQEFEDYILGPLSISYPTIAAYPPFANKTTNQLVVKGDIYTTGTITMEPAYGIYFTSSTNGNLAAFSYPVTTISTINYDFQVYADNGSGFGFELYIDGTISSPSSYAHITIYSNDQIVDQCDIFASSGPQSVLLSFPYTIVAPASIRVVVEDGGINNGVVDVKFPISSVAVSRTTGQYQVVASAKAGPQFLDNLQGYIYRSIDYGVNFQKVGGQQSTLVGYWNSIAISDNGQYVVAGEQYGKLVFSNDYGANFTDITGNILLCGYPFQSLGISNVSISGNGQYIGVCLTAYNCPYPEQGYKVRGYLSRDYGASFQMIHSELADPTNQTIQSEINSDGTLIVFTRSDGSMRSFDYGYNWYIANTGLVGFKKAISMTSDGSAIAMNGLDTYTSTNNASSWSAITSAYTFRNIAVFKDLGSNRFYTLTYSANNTYPIFISGSNFTGPITGITGPGNKQWWAISASDNGQYILVGTCNYYAVDNNYNELWRSSDYGHNWIKI